MLHFKSWLSCALYFCFIGALLSFSTNSYASDLLSSNLFSIGEVIDLYEKQAFLIYDNITQFATTVLYYFAVFSLVIAGIYQIFTHGNIGDICFIIVRVLIIVGIFEFFIKYGYVISRDLINSLIGIYSDYQTGTAHVVEVFTNFYALVEEFAKGIQNQNSGFFILFLGSAYLIVTLLVIHYCITYIITLFVSLIGVIVMGLGGLSFTRAYAFNYFRLVLACGIKLFSLGFIFQISQQVILYLIIQLRYVVSQGEVVHVQEAGFVIMIMLFTLLLSYSLPSTLASLVYTTHTYSVFSGSVTKLLRA